MIAKNASPKTQDETRITSLMNNAPEPDHAFEQRTREAERIRGLAQQHAGEQLTELRQEQETSTHHTAATAPSASKGKSAAIT